jgi:hypothetical protein
MKRFVTDGIVSGPPPAGESWPERIEKGRIEQDAGRRTIRVADDSSGPLGMVHVIFRFPPGYTDPKAANGRDVAMIESLRTCEHVQHLRSISSWTMPKPSPKYTT